MLLLVSCHVAININIFICSGTWRGGCLCWTAWPPQQDAGQDALWEVNELRSFSVGSDISLAWRDLDHLQDFISSQYNLDHCWFFLQMITSATEADHPWSSIFRISLSEIKEHDWVTMYGLNPLLKEEENCQLIEVRQWSGKDYWKRKGWWKSFFKRML